jgi:hypothetical protein
LLHGQVRLPALLCRHLIVTALACDITIPQILPLPPGTPVALVTRRPES